MWSDKNSIILLIPFSSELTIAGTQFISEHTFIQISKGPNVHSKLTGPAPDNHTCRLQPKISIEDSRHSGEPETESPTFNETSAVSIAAFAKNKEGAFTTNF